MKLKFTQTVEQGSKAGMLKFRAGTYSAEKSGDGFLVTHEPVTRRIRVDGKRKVVAVTQTQVPAAIVEKMLKLGVAEEGE